MERIYLEPGVTSQKGSLCEVVCISPKTALPPLCPELLKLCIREHNLQQAEFILEARQLHILPWARKTQIRD